MSDLEYLKQYQKIKDISDVIGDIEKLDCLVYQNDWQAVNQHFGNISQKHPIEKSIYNLAKPIPPQSPQQSAANCRQFLVTLGKSKIAEEFSKHLGGN